MQHRLSDKNPDLKTAFCKGCDKVVDIRRKGSNPDGSPRWRCKRNDNDWLNARGRRYIRHKKDVCERCGFIPEHKSQLDVDHIDGNHSNDDLSNLQTLCANCHRLKTYMERQGTVNAYSE